MENSTKPVPKIVLTGPSCMFKTTALKELKKMGVETVSGDYASHSKAEPAFENKHGKPAVELEYQLYVLAHMKPGFVHDRFCFDSIIYSRVFDVYDGRMTLEEAKAELVDACRRTVIPLMQTREYVVVVVQASEDKYEDVHQRMLKRQQDPKDNLSIRYVEIQNELFKVVANECSWKTFTVDSYDDMDKVIDYLEHVYLSFASVLNPRDEREM